MEGDNGVGDALISLYEREWAFIAAVGERVLSAKATYGQVELASMMLLYGDGREHCPAHIDARLLDAIAVARSTIPKPQDD